MTFHPFLCVLFFLICGVLCETRTIQLEISSLEQIDLSQQYPFQIPNGDSTTLRKKLTQYHQTQNEDDEVSPSNPLPPSTNPPHPLSSIPTSDFPLGANSQAVVDIEWIGPAKHFSMPPDPHLAKGPSSVVVMTNDYCGIRNISTGVSLTPEVLLHSFMGNQAFDPRVFYDNDNGRFIAACNKGGTVDNSALVIYISKNSNPTSFGNDSWTKTIFTYGTSTNPAPFWADYPAVSIDSFSIKATQNLFDTNGYYYGSILLIFNKSQLLNPIPNTTIDYLLLQPECGGTNNVPTMFPAFHQSNISGNPTETLMVSSYSFFQKCIYLLDGHENILNVSSSSTLVDVASNTPPKLFQNGNPNLEIDTGDDRFLTVVFHNDTLHATFTTRDHSLPIGISSSVVMEYNPFTHEISTFSINSQKTSFFYPAVGISMNGDSVVAVCAGNSTLYPSIYYSTKKKNVNNMFNTPQPVKYGESVDNQFADRWGDYGSCAPDYDSPNSVWCVQEYQPQDSQAWSVLVFRVTSCSCSSSKVCLTDYSCVDVPNNQNEDTKPKKVKANTPMNPSEIFITILVLLVATCVLVWAGVKIYKKRRGFYSPIGIDNGDEDYSVNDPFEQENDNFHDPSVDYASSNEEHHTDIHPNPSESDSTVENDQINHDDPFHDEYIVASEKIDL